MDNEEKPVASSNAFNAFMDTKKGQSILRGVEIGLVAISLALSAAALIVVLTTNNKSEPTTHVVTFRNYDNAFITSETIKDGEVATNPEITPSKPSDSVNTYSFSGWDKEFTIAITEDTTYTAQYAATLIPVVTPATTYTVRFINDDTAKSVLYSCSVKSGDKASYQGVTPTKATDANYSYTFTDWDKSTDTAITANTDFTAQYSKVAIVAPATTYAVRFLNEDGSVLYSENVVSGDTAKFGMSPTKESKEVGTSYRFAGWDKDITAKITANTDFKAQYDTYYLATFTDEDGNVLDEQEIKKGTYPSASITNPTKGSVAFTSYTFASWKEKVSGTASSSYVMNSKATFIASYTEGEITTTGLTLTPDNESSPTYYTVTGYTGTDEYVVIPEKASDGVVITHLAKTAFTDNTTIKGVKANWITSIDDGTSETPGLTEIITGAFSNCTKLVDVSFPALTGLGKYAFYGCSKLSTYSFPLLTEISDNAFNSCTSITEFDFPLVITVGNYSFIHCSGLTTLNNSTLTSIGTNAFSYDDSLTYVYCDNLTSLGSQAFAENSKLQLADVSEVTEIPTFAFYNCQSLTRLSIYYAESIGADAFMNCISLTSIEIPHVTSIGTQGFANCKSLESVQCQSLTTMDSTAFSTCINLSEVTTSLISGGTTASSIWYDSKINLEFNYSPIAAGGPTSITIPDNYFKDSINFTKFTSYKPIVKVGKHAFDNTAISTFPTLTDAATIDSYGFSKCTKLSSIDLSSYSTMTICDSSFAGIGYIETFKLPGAFTFTNNSANYQNYAPFAGDSFGTVIYAGTTNGFDVVAADYSSAYGGAKIFPSGTTVTCTSDNGTRVIA